MATNVSYYQDLYFHYLTKNHNHIFTSHERTGIKTWLIRPLKTLYMYLSIQVSSTWNIIHVSEYTGQLYLEQYTCIWVYRSALPGTVYMYLSIQVSSTWNIIHVSKYWYKARILDFDLTICGIRKQGLGINSQFGKCMTEVLSWFQAWKFNSIHIKTDLAWGHLTIE